MLPEIYLRYADIFAKHGFSLYLVGGSVRDYLLGLEVRDLDFVTNAIPSEVCAILPNACDRFSKFGVVSIKEDGKPIDIVTFRFESGYLDSRHPNKVTFVKDMYLDSCRRDFTINAMYMDSKGFVYDFHGGLQDLRDKTIRFIGKPEVRIMEDPLRILRAERFAKRLGFAIEENSKNAMDEGIGLLEKINPEKINMERKKE